MCVPAGGWEGKGRGGYLLRRILHGALNLANLSGHACVDDDATAVAVGHSGAAEHDVGLARDVAVAVLHRVHLLLDGHALTSEGCLLNPELSHRNKGKNERLLDLEAAVVPLWSTT